MIDRPDGSQTDTAEVSAPLGVLGTTALVSISWCCRLTERGAPLSLDSRCGKWLHPQ